MSIILATILFGAMPDGPEIFDGPRLIQAVKGLQAEIRSLFVVFEGEFEFVGPERLYAPRKQRPRHQYQGNYIYREDGASLLEAYQRSSLQTGSPLVVERSANLRGRLETQTLSPYRGRINAEINRASGNAASLDAPGSAARILLLWYFGLLSEQTPPSVSEQAWEVIEGHTCLRVRIDRYPQFVGAKKRTERFWVDMERGGHPIKIEWLVDEKVDLRTYNVKLERCPIGKDRSVWFPMSGVVDSFVWGDEIYDSPVIHESYGIVVGSINVNGDFPDRAFRLATASEFTGSPYLAKARASYDDEAKRKSEEPGEPITPAAVQARLDRELKEADQQSQALDASSDRSDSWSWPAILQVVLFVSGMVALVLAIRIRKAR